MSDVSIIYGSSTGNTEAAANQIARLLNGQTHNVAAADANDFDAKLLVLGTSTWGLGDLQDDWSVGISLLDRLDLNGQLVALFGFGDQSGFADSFVDGMGTLYAKAIERGAKVIGKTSAQGYGHSASTAEENGEFCGLALDNDNEPDKTDARIAAWVEQLKQESAS